MFWFTLATFLLGSAMCWINHFRKLVLICWGIWLIAFFILPFVVQHGWFFLVIQTILALVMIMRWKIDAAMP